MLKIQVIAIGRVKEDWMRQGIAEYQKRLGAYCKFEIIELEEYRLPDHPSEAEIARGLEEEGNRILKKAAGLDIQYLCPLHGPVWRENIGWFLEKYKRWSTYTPEAWTAAIFCGSIYGHTENACEILASRLAEKGVRHVRIFDVSHTDVSEQVSAAFQCSHLVFASATYNGGIYTPMETLLLELKAHALQNRTVALIENGSWGPAAARLMAKHLEEMKGMEQIAPPITIRSAVKEEQYRKLEDLADLIAADIAAEE